MANCNELFQQFNREIKLDDGRRVNLREKRNILRDQIKNGYLETKKFQQITEELDFQSQGSYVMDTIINPERADDEYDLDDGIYFIGSRSKTQRPTTAQFHQFVIESINKGKKQLDIEEIVDKNTCVRIRYKGKNGEFNYHIDMPIYYASNIKQPDLADKKEDWYLSTPVEFILWFENLIQSGFKVEYIFERAQYKDEYETWLNDRRKKDHQLRRIVRYLKAWGDNLKGDMPPGVVMTILAGSNSNYKQDARDDLSLEGTLVNIENWLSKNGFTCPRPTPQKGEDLFKGYSQIQKTYFREALQSFITSAHQAVASQNPKDACLKWKKHLGSRFPCHLAKDEIEGSKSYLTAAAIKSDNAKSA